MDLNQKIKYSKNLKKSNRSFKNIKKNSFNFYSVQHISSQNDQKVA